MNSQLKIYKLIYNNNNIKQMNYQKKLRDKKHMKIK